jgi:ubiquinone/menaquinone biosynthesis C-methylase UbiE
MDYLQGQVFESYSSHNLRRLKGELPEKESSKAVIELLRSRLTNNQKVLEVGSSVGHLAKSLGKLKLNLHYTGVDIDQYAISKGIEFLNSNTLSGVQHASLLEAPAESLPYANQSFDVVISLNVLEHLKEPRKAIQEFVRCSRKYVLIRTLVSDQTFIVQEVRNSNHINLGYKHLELPLPQDELDENGIPKVFIYQNVYSKDLIQGIVSEEKTVKHCEIFEDLMFSQKAFDLDNKLSNLPRATKVIEGKQVRGLFIDTHYWILIEKK